MARLWDPETGDKVATLGGHAGAVTCVATSRDGTVAASASDDGAVRVWRLADGASIASYDAAGGAVHGLAFGRDGLRRVSRTPGMCMIPSGGITSAPESVLVTLDFRDDISMPRFALLEHSGAPDDPAGLHWDLLLETGESCRTWRLSRVPVCGGDAVAAEEIAPHRLAWLDHEAGEVSGGRGFARRVDAGTYETLGPPDARGPDGGPDATDASLVARLRGCQLSGTLVLESVGGSAHARLVSDR